MKDPEELPVATGEWECAECGYIQDGVRTRKPRECPECGAPAQALDFFPYDDDADSSWGRAAPEDDDDLDEGIDDEDVY